MQGFPAQLSSPHTYLASRFYLAVAFGVMVLLLLMSVLSTVVSTYGVRLPPV